MYAKIFTQIYDGTLCTNHPWQALVTFQQLLVLADQEGSVDMTPRAISRRTGIPLEIIELGIAELLLPDPESRTPDEGGRRIVPLVEGRDWGWKVVNYVAYRSLKREEERRDYHRRYYQQNRSVAARSTEKVETQHAQPIQPIAEAEAEEVNVNTSGESQNPLSPISPAKPVDKFPCPHQKIVELFHEELPVAQQVVVWSDSRKRLLQSLWLNVFNEKKFKSVDEGIEYFRNFFNFISQSDFLCGRAQPSNGRKPFIVSLEWAIKPANYVKIIEGTYHA